LSPLFDVGAQLAELVMPQLVALLPHKAESYGKGAIVGVNGDLEHAAALCNPKMGKPMRAALGGGEALIPSTQRVAAAGATLDLPLGHKDNPWSFDHFETVTVGVPDAPRPDEIVVAIGIADGGRVNPRGGSTSYTGVAKALHWLLAALIFGQIAFGWYLPSVPRTTPSRTVSVNLHKSTGLTLGLFVLVRLGWRLTHKAPPLPAS